jgi:hypothetical protein
MIRSRLNKPKLRVAVYPDASGWHATVYAEPGAARDLQSRVDEATGKGATPSRIGRPLVIGAVSALIRLPLGTAT